MALKHALLGLLINHPQHGYDLKREFDEKLGAVWNLNYGQIYTTLERLTRDGLVEYSDVSQDDKPDKKVYKLTEQGRAEVGEWFVSPIKNEPRTLRDELFLKMLFIDLTEPEVILHQIQEQHSVYMTYMMQLTNRKYQLEQTAKRAISKADDDDQRQKHENDHLISLVVLDAALFHTEADIRWLKHSAERIKEMIAKNS